MRWEMMSNTAVDSIGDHLQVSRDVFISESAERSIVRALEALVDEAKESFRAKWHEGELPIAALFGDDCQLTLQINGAAYSFCFDVVLLCGGKREGAR